MTQQRDTEQLLDAWMRDGPTVAPDRVLDIVVDRIERQGQRPAWRLDWRRYTMNPSLKIAAAALAVVIVAVIGYNLLPAGTTNVGVPMPTLTASPTPATPTPTPTPNPSPSVVYPAWFTQQGDGAGILPAGSTTTRQFLGGSTFTVPQGWVNDGDYAQVYSLFPDTPANEAEYALSKQTAQNVLLTDMVQNNMFAICDATGLFQGATASEVVDAVVANQAFSTTEPVDVTIAGLSGRQVDLQLSPDWAGSCPLNADDPPTRDYRDARNRLILLDTPTGSTIGIAIGSLYSSEFEAFLAEAMPIVESFTFGLGPEASPVLSPPSAGTSIRVPALLLFAFDRWH